MTSSSGRLFFVTPVEKAQFVPRALHSGDFLPPFFESSGEKRFAYSRPQIRKRGQKNPRLCPRYEITIIARSFSCLPAQQKKKRSHMIWLTG